jgi:isoquinoline 1-oxidoreductase alpha subunit
MATRVENMKAELRVNGEPRAIEADGDTPLLWVLRDHLRMTGTKFGCGIGQCGACTVHINGVATRSCLVPFASTIGTSITTIEGLLRNGTQTLQRAWLEDNVPQCGYCQSGMLMAAAALLHQHDSPTDEQINSSITNICRCGTYPRVRAAIHKAAARMHAAQNPIAFSISIGRWGAILKTVQGSKAAGYATEVAV